MDSHSDLTTSEGVQEYLSQTQFAASNVSLLAGGYSNFTYRITLREPYTCIAKGSNAPILIRSMVLKHAEPYVAMAKKNFPFAVERQDFETLAFQGVPELTAPSSVVSVPTLFHEDRQQRVLIISDCGEHSTTLKALLRTAPPNIEISRTIGHSLGTFLARLHIASHASEGNLKSTSASPGLKLKTAFAANTQARAISSYVTYSRVVVTLVPPPEVQPTDSNTVTPPIELSSEQMATIVNVSKTMQGRIASSDEVLTMGDFWPGNLIVSLEPDSTPGTGGGLHINVVDWELAKPGMAGLDIGQFFAELTQMRTFYPSSSVSVDTIVSGFTEAYRSIVLGSGSKLDLVEVTRIAATHVGAHLIVLTPRTGWGGKELTREVVMKGMEHILRVADGDQAWLKKSVIGGLLG